MTKFELRYGGCTIETEFDGTLEEFTEELYSTVWWIIESEGVAIQVKQIDRVKEIK